MPYPWEVERNREGRERLIVNISRYVSPLGEALSKHLEGQSWDWWRLPLDND